MRARVIGKKIGRDKEGRISSNLFVAKDFSNYDREKNLVEGEETRAIWCRLDLSDIHTGMLVDVNYDVGFGDKAVLESITPVEDIDI